MKEPTEVAIKSCSPECPFGCPASWGRQLFSNWGEARAHVCNLAEHHGGDHVCACGVQMNDGCPTQEEAT